jgi:flagellar hook-associated protein 2
MAIGTLGVGSGLDLEGLVTKLITNEGKPRFDRLATKEAKVQANISAFGSLKSSLDKLRTAANDLNDTAAVGKRGVSTGGSKLFSASATSSATIGNYSIQVLGKATAQKLASTADFSSGTALAGAGTLSITSGSNSFSVTTDATTTLQGLRDAINGSASNTSVAASLLVVAKDPLDASAGTVTRLVLTAKETGTANAIQTSVTDADLDNTDNAGLSRFYYSSSDPVNSRMSQTQAAANARIAVDGFTAISSSNTFSDVAEGVTITVQEPPADPLNPAVETLGITQDTTAASGRLKSFVTAYNDLAKTIRDLSAYDKTTNKGAALSGDATLRAISSQLRGIASTAGLGSGTPGSLSDIGVSFQTDGNLKIDSAKLDTALKNQLPGVSALLTGTGGVGARFDAALDSILDSGGTLEARTQGFDKQLKSISAERETVISRLDRLEASYRTRFSALDATVARLKSDGDYLLAQLQSTSQIISGRKG